MTTNTDACGNKMRYIEDVLAENKYTSSIYQFWKKSLPDELRLSKSLRNVRLPIGIFVQLCGMGMFLTFLLMGINTAKHASFLSLDKTAGNCNDVKIQISDIYTVDYNGYWSTSPDYDDSMSIFEIKFIGVEMNNEEYKYFTQKELYPYLKNLNMESNTWSQNYMIWTQSSSKEFSYGGGKIILSFLSNPYILSNYKNQFYSQNCVLQSGNCQTNINDPSMGYANPRSYLSLLQNNLVNEQTPVYDSSNLDCNLTPDKPNTMGNGLQGFGLNFYGQDTDASVSVVQPYRLSSSGSQITVPWAFEYGSGIGSIPDNVCKSDYSSTLFFPIIGTGLFSPTQNPNTYAYYNTLSAISDDCNVCTSSMNSACSGSQELSLFIGALEVSYTAGSECQNCDANTGLCSSCAFEDFYTQQAINQRSTLNTPLFPLIDIMNTNYNVNNLINDATLKQYINFNSIESISIVQFQVNSLYPNLNLNGGLTINSIQLSCSDSLGELGPFRPGSYATVNAPTQLTENYYVCVPTESSAFLDSFGIAVANTGTFMGIFLTIVITCYIAFVKYTSKTVISAVTSDDIENILEIFGTSLVNRSVIRQKKEKLPPGYITNISNELVDEEKAIESGNNIELSTVENPVSKNVKNTDL